jgi:DNA-binding SARP family transcriptional activator
MISSPGSGSSRHRVSHRPVRTCLHACRGEPGSSAEFRLLGPVEVRRGGSPIPVGGPRETKTLAILLLHAGCTVSVGQLVRALWDDAPPQTANEQVGNNVARLRRRLNGGEPSTPDLIARVENGFAVSVDPDQLDTGRFDRLVRQARAASDRGHLAAARDLLDSALGLWRGPALGGLAGRYLQAQALRLEAQRQSCEEGRIECDLALGRHHDVACELAALLIQHPTREQLLELYMLALYRCGRRQDALHTFTSARARLADELGLDPPASTQALHQAILRGDHALADPTYGLRWAAPRPA